MNDKLLSLLGICRKAGKLSSGFDAAAESVKRREAALILTAADLSPKSKKEIEFVAAKEHVETMAIRATLNEIGMKTGRRAGILAVNDKGLARSVKAEALREHEKGE